MKEVKINSLDERNIPYVIIRKKVKSFRLKIDDKGIVKITYPYLTKEESLIKFVEKHIAWIIEKRKIVKSNEVLYENDSVHYVFGEKCILKINYSKTTRVDKVGNIIMVSTSKLDNIRNIMLKWRMF